MNALIKKILKTVTVRPSGGNGRCRDDRCDRRPLVREQRLETDIRCMRRAHLSICEL